MEQNHKSLWKHVDQAGLQYEDVNDLKEKVRRLYTAGAAMLIDKLEKIITKKNKSELALNKANS